MDAPTSGIHGQARRDFAETKVVATAEGAEEPPSPESAPEGASDLDAASLKFLSRLLGEIKDSLNNEKKSAATGFSPRVVSELERILEKAAAVSAKAAAGSASDARSLDRTPASRSALAMPGRVGGKSGETIPQNDSSENLKGRNASATAFENAFGKTQSPETPYDGKGARASTGADAAILTAGTGGDKRTVESHTRREPTAAVMIKTEAGEFEIDLKALKSLLRGETAASSLPGRSVPADRIGSTDAAGQNLYKALAGLSGGGHKEVVAVKIVHAGTEKKLSLRPVPTPFASVASGGAQTDGSEAAVFRFADEPPGGKRSAALNFGRSEVLANGNGKRAATTGNRFAENQAFGDPQSSADLKNAPLKNALSESGTGIVRGDLRQTLGGEKFEPDSMIAVDRSETRRGGGQAAAAGVNASTGGDRSEIRPEPQAVIRQVADRVEEALNRGANRIRMELTPPRLGTLDMDLTVSDDRVKIVILVDSREARHILQSNMDQLRSALQQQGLKMDGVDVLLQDRGHPGNLFGQNWGQPGSGGGQFQQERYPGGMDGTTQTAASTQTSEQAGRELSSSAGGAGLSVFA